MTFANAGEPAAYQVTVADAYSANARPESVSGAGEGAGHDHGHAGV